MNETLIEWMARGSNVVWLSVALLGGAGVTAFIASKSEGGFDGSRGKKITIGLIGCWWLAVFFGVPMPRRSSSWPSRKPPATAAWPGKYWRRGATPRSASW